MGLIYFKRYRMEIDLAGPLFDPPELPPGYRLLPWDESLLEAHAEAKYLCFQMELDANVFPCLADHSGCLRLMGEIASRDGFLGRATWLAQYRESDSAPPENCGTIQGVDQKDGAGAVQNLGITPGHRDVGVGSALMLKALEGFREAGLRRGRLEVTAKNTRAIQLYERMGFRRVKTAYKAANVEYA